MDAIIGLLVVVVVVGLLVYLAETYLPLPAPFRVVLRVLVVLFLILWILRVLGFWTRAIGIA